LRAHPVLSHWLKEDYKFGDITKEALKRGGNVVKDFTGKDTASSTGHVVLGLQGMPCGSIKCVQNTRRVMLFL